MTAPRAPSSGAGSDPSPAGQADAVHLTARARAIAPFYAVAIYQEAMAMAASGRSIILSVGEPDFATPSRVIDAAASAMRRGETHYTAALGIPPLRSALAGMYRERYAQHVDENRILVTVGASGALALAFAVLFETGDEVMMADPGYPSNRALLSFCDASANLVPVGSAERFQLTAALVDAHWTPRTKGVMVASPANPTGTTIADDELHAIAECVRARGGVLIVDEIYHGLTYGRRPETALALGDDVFVVNSFSKYYCMTGWRLGWLVAPVAYLAAVERLSQHLFIAPPTPAQWAGLAALEPASTEIYEAQREEFRARRDFLLPALAEAGLPAACVPDGAFYAYLDVSACRLDSWTFCQQLLQQTGVAITPGRDFGRHRARDFVRLSYTCPQPQLADAVARISEFAHRHRR
jgi:aspartate/methionine/tyrosine aminotransferase